jgi:SAM-dependent methyltransferase
VETEIQWTEEKSRRLWDYYARTLQPADYFSRHSGGHILRAVRPWADLRNGSILDFGCGPGYLLEHLVRRSSGKVFGLDFSAGSIARTDGRLNGEPRYGGAWFTRDLPSPVESSSMDTVISIEVIEHLTDDMLQGMFREIRRILKDDGRLVITTPNEEDLETSKLFCPNCESRYHRWQHIRSWSADSLKALLTDNGFAPVVVRATCFRSMRAGWAAALKNTVARILGRSVAVQKPHLFAVATKRT